MTGDDLPVRSGGPPLVTGPSPHEQVTQTAPVELQEKLVSLASELPGVAVRQSLVSVPGARGLRLAPTLARGPLRAFLVGTEFAHIHPCYDGSLHVTLPDDLARAAVESGWGEPHPKMDATLIFGPRDEEELTVVWTLLRASYRYATGGGPRPGVVPVRLMFSRENTHM